MDKLNHKLMVVLDNDIFISVVSIGDIQRAIIKNIDLNSSISNILRKEVRFAYDTENIDVIKEHMKTYRNEFMPIISSSGKLVNIIFWNDIFGKEKYHKKEDIRLNLPVVIMAGGIGSRLKPLTNILPKPLIPIRDKTIIEDIMDRFVDYGCRDFHLSVNYKSDMIRYYLNSINNSSYNINYFEETVPSGTAGSLCLLKGKINSTFFVTNCDIIIDENYDEILKYHTENKNEITIVAAIKNYQLPYGSLTTLADGLLESIHEKPELTFKINTGFYILEPQLLNEIPNNKFYHITHLIDKLHQMKRRIGVFPVNNGSWIDIGNWNEYLSQIDTTND